MNYLMVPTTRCATCMDVLPPALIYSCCCYFCKKCIGTHIMKCCCFVSFITRRRWNSLDQPYRVVNYDCTKPYSSLEERWKYCEWLPGYFMWCITHCSSVVIFLWESTNEIEALLLKQKNTLKLTVHNEMLIKTDLSLYVIIVTLEFYCNLTYWQGVLFRYLCFLWSFWSG
jgi:hypothetical protein